MAEEQNYTGIVSQGSVIFDTPLKFPYHDREVEIRSLPYHFVADAQSCNRQIKDGDKVEVSPCTIREALTLAANARKKFKQTTTPEEEPFILPGEEESGPVNLDEILSLDSEELEPPEKPDK